MWESIIYKEWLKTRWTLFVFTILGILILVNIFLQVRHDILFIGATEFWYGILFKGYNYGSLLKFIPFLTGLSIAIAQYFPETVNSRIKLTFHLPINENKILMGIHAYGLFCLLIIFSTFISIFLILSSIYFPSEIINSILITITPWFIGGISTYFMCALILLEPVWKYKVLYALVVYGYVSLYYLKSSIGAYAPALLSLLLVTLLSSIVVLFSGYRIRKGEM